VYSSKSPLQNREGERGNVYCLLPTSNQTGWLRKKKGEASPNVALQKGKREKMNYVFLYGIDVLLGGGEEGVCTPLSPFCKILLEGGGKREGKNPSNPKHIFCRTIQCFQQQKKRRGGGEKKRYIYKVS